MADSGIFRLNPLQGWQRDAVLKAAQLLRERFGDDDAKARVVRDSLLEVLDPARRTVRMQKELSAATRITAPPEKAERRQRDRRAIERRKANVGPAADLPDRRRRDRRSTERRNKR